MKNTKLIVGLTGGIGSGKSEACRLFAARGIVIVDADNIARDVVLPGSTALHDISLHFGEEILTTSGELDRRKLRDIIFSNPHEKKWLENLLHPIINLEIRNQLANAESPYVILASPLLLETRQFELTNRILVIDASEQLQIERASKRDRNDTDQIKAIMNTQLSRQERCAKADDIIQNHGNLDELDEQIEKLHQRYLEMNS